MRIFGLAPYINPRRPRDAARWWSAHGALDDGELHVETLLESESPLDVEGLCGIAAPLSLPGPFLDFLGGDDTLTAQQMRERARVFSMQAPRGKRHPRRNEIESLSAIDRRRLPLFCAARPLLASGARVVEVDPTSLLRALDLPCDGLTGDRPDGIERRMRIVDGLRDGALGVVHVAPREYAIASAHALHAVLAAALAAWVYRNDVRPPDSGADAWIPLP